MRNTKQRSAQRKLTVPLAASVLLAAVSLTNAAPVFAQAPSMMSADGPIALTQQQCMAVAKSVIASLGGTETAANEKRRAMERGNFITSIDCSMPGRLLVHTAAPRGTDPEPEVDAVLLAFLSHAKGKGAGRPSPASVQMPALPKTYEEAWSTSQPINRSFLVGRWTNNGNCNPGSIEFHNDGTLTSPGEKGRWSFEGDDLTTIGDRKYRQKVRGVGKDRFFSFAAGKFSQVIRC